MQTRRLGSTNFLVSSLSLGTWQVGGRWGSSFDDALAERILETAIDEGVLFFDTADVYSNRASEAAVGRVLARHRSRSGPPLRIATKCGRFLSPHVAAAYTPEALRGFVEASLRNTGLDALDLVQLHCPPTAVYAESGVFELFERLVEEGKILALGVSVETVAEARRALAYDNVRSIQIIANLLRWKPTESFFAEAAAKDVGLIARVPLASGLLTGRFDEKTTFEPEDHRAFNRDGAAFDKGETFSGVPYEVGIEAARRLATIFPKDAPLSAWALRFLLDFSELSTVIPGASSPEQVRKNVAAATLRSLSEDERRRARAIYDELVRPHVHELW